MRLMPYQTGTLSKISDIENVKNSISNTEPFRSVRHRFGTGTGNGTSILVPHWSPFYILQPSNFDFLKLGIEGVDQLQEIETF